MRVAKLCLSLFLIIGISGCAALPPLLGIKEAAINQVFTIESSPPDADVYINDKLVGRTPCKVPVVLNIDTATYWPKEQYLIRVSKEGYRDEVKPIEFKQRANIFDRGYDEYFGAEIAPGTKVWYFYNFTLQKKE